MKDNLYWAVYKNLEKELLDLSYQIHIDDNQLGVYSVKIAELLLRCSVEIESIAKDLYEQEGGNEKGNPKFDSVCLKFLEDKWLLSKKKVYISAASFYLMDGNNILTPLLNAELGSKDTNSPKWKQAYMAIKHDRAKSLPEFGNIGNLINAMAVLFLLNVYHKNESFKLGPNGENSSFPWSMGSEIFNIKLQKWTGNTDNGEATKSPDYDECVFVAQMTEESKSKYRELIPCINDELIQSLKRHPNLFAGIPQSITEIQIKSEIGDKEHSDIMQRLTHKMQNLWRNSDYEAVLNKEHI